MTTTNNESPVAIHGHTMYIGLPSKALSLDAQELRAEMEKAIEDSESTIEEIRFDGYVDITGSAYKLFAQMPQVQKISRLDMLDVSDVTSMQSMFEGDLSLESSDLVQGMSNWDMSRVEKMNHMFKDCRSLKDIKISARGTDLGALKYACGMFRGCSALTTVDMSYNTAPNLDDVSHMFEGCTSLDNVNLKRLNTRRLTSMACMFEGCENLRDLSLDGFDASNAKFMTRMFCGCTNLIRISARDSRWPDANRVFDADMFHDCDMLSDIGDAQVLAPFIEKSGITQDTIDARRARAYMLVRREGDTLTLGDPATPMDTNGLNLRHEICRLCGEDELPKKIEIVGDIHISGSAAYLFSPAKGVESIEGMRHLDTSLVTDMSGMFCEMYALKSVDVSGFDTSCVTSMHDMFCECENLKKIDVSSFDTHSVKNMDYMFERCTSLRSLDLSSFDMSNVTSAASLCNCCFDLEKASIAGWHAPNLVDVQALFGNCYKLAELDTTGFTTTRVADTNGMFCGCQTLETLDLRGLSGTSECVSDMFRECSSLRVLDIENLEVDSSKPSNATFAGCNALGDICCTESMANEIGYQETNRRDTIIIDRDQLLPSPRGWQEIALTLSDENGMRKRTLTVPNKYVRDNGGKTLDIELPSRLVRVYGVEGGQEVSEIMSAREIHYQSDVAREIQNRQIKELIPEPTPDNVDYEDASEGNHHDEFPF